MRILLGVLLLCASCASHGPPEYQVEGECRAGRPHGRYVARGPGGDRVEGRFCDGVRCGVFTFYSGPDLKLAEFPYRGRLPDGTVQVWYLPYMAPQSPHRRKFRGAYGAGKPHGESRTWWPSGEVRSAFVYRHGELSGGSAWSAEGKELGWSEAIALADRDGATRGRLFQALGSIVTANPPDCGGR